MTKRKNSKNKGGTFERAVCKELSLWWTSGERDDVFTRSSISGGRATVRAKQNKTTANSAGDIAYLDDIGKPFISQFTVEVKRGYPAYELQRVVDRMDGSNPSVLEQWIAQAIESQKIAGSRSWLLIAKKDRAKTLVYIPFRDYLRIVRWNQDRPIAVICGILLEEEGETCERSSVVCMPLETFFECVSPQDIVKDLEAPRSTTYSLRKFDKKAA